MSAPVVYQKLLDAIHSGKQISKYDAAELVPCHHRTAQRVLARMHKERLIRICDWHPIYHQMTAVYCLKNSGRDISKPKPVTAVETTRRYRAKPEKREKIIKQKRAKRIIQGAYQSKAANQIFNLIVKVAA